jgi:hypothetical protein
MRQWCLLSSLPGSAEHHAHAVAVRLFFHRHGATNGQQACRWYGAGRRRPGARRRRLQPFSKDPNKPARCWMRHALRPYIYPPPIEKRGWK